jgi:ribose-phosphate pyrophosphokinase
MAFHKGLHVIKIGDHILTPTIFPDGTSQVWKLPLDKMKSELVNVDWEFQHEGEFMQLAQLKRLLDSMLYQTDLFLSYLPYGRQDKVVNNRSTFALEPFANLLNHLNFRKVFILDPHSDEYRMINNSEAIYPWSELEEVIRRTQVSAICYPDHGAFTKYKKIYSNETRDKFIVVGEKVRDQSTGKITDFKIMFESPLNGQSVLIIDDICDGGATFCLVAKKLIELNAAQVHLFVTHGLFTRGLRPLQEALIDRIFTPDGEITEIQNTIAIKPLRGIK